MRPGISERTFEFCYNAEFCDRHNALLATHPHIPSQNSEGELGYDVEFEIQNRQFTKSIFLQHKVAHFVENRAGRNADFYNTHAGPYFRFKVNNKQHNLLFELGRNQGNAFYCAPRFHTRNEMETNFRRDSISRYSLLLNPLEIGKINDNSLHNITYAPLGYPKVLHSEPKRFSDEVFGGEKLPPLKEFALNKEYVNQLSKQLIESTFETRLDKLIPRRFSRQSPIKQVQYILGRFYNVSWILLT